QRVRPDDLEPRDAMDGMGHGLPEWFDLDRRLPRLQEIPIVLQFLSVNLSPSLHEPLLCLGHFAAEAFDRVHGKDRRVVLVIRVKMRGMMGLALLSEHPNDDPEEPRQLRHGATLHRRSRFRRWAFRRANGMAFSRGAHESSGAAGCNARLADPSNHLLAAPASSHPARIAIRYATI